MMMTREITEEETKKLLNEAQSGLLFRIQWEYHAAAYMYYMHR
jgi:hypothetical protein